MKEIEKEIKYENIFFFSILHIMTAVGFYYFFDWTYVFVGLCLWVTMGLGLGIGYHRFLIHQGFKTSRTMEIILTLFGGLTMQGNHLEWIAKHWLHHETTETVRDPHSPRNGFWHSHILWMIYADKSLSDPALIQKYAKRLSKDPFHYGLSRVWWLPGAVVGTILFLIGGFPALLLGLIFPVTLCFQCTWSVNSVAHYWGAQPHNTGDDSRNNLIVALISWGEGWHNNHHDQPARARHGVEWYQFDPCWYVIWVCGKVKLVDGIKA